MKTKRLLFMFIAILFTSMTIIVACQKNEHAEVASKSNQKAPTATIDEKIAFYHHELQKRENTGDNIFRKIWKWLVAHSGTHLFENCNLPSNCGPCPGICANASKSSSTLTDADMTPVASDYLLSKEEWDGGARLLQMALLNDTIMEITLLHRDLTSSDTLYIPSNTSIGTYAAQEFSKSSIIIKKGKYPLSYSYSSNGTTILDVVCRDMAKK